MSVNWVQFDLNARDLSYVNADGVRLVNAGSYEIAVGGGQPTTSAPKVTRTLKITGEFRLEP